VGEVHEYIHCKSGQQTPGYIDGYWLRHDSAGGQDGKRFERDEDILLKVCLAAIRRAKQSILPEESFGRTEPHIQCLQCLAYSPCLPGLGGV